MRRARSASCARGEDREEERTKSSSPPFRLHSPKIRKKIQPVLQAKIHHICNTTLSSYRAIAVIFQVISVPLFSAKNAFVTGYRLESSLARFNNVLCCFQTISCLLSFKEGNQWIFSAACLFSSQ